MSEPVIPIDFARDNAWLEQLKRGDILLEEENLALWKNMLSCFYIAQTFEATLLAVEVRQKALEAENTQARRLSAAALRPVGHGVARAAAARSLSW